MNGNEPAFPSGESYVTTDLAGNTSSHKRGPFHKGMDLRTYLAAKAMNGMLVNSYSLEDIAARAVWMANDLIAELSKPVVDQQAKGSKQ